MDKETIQPSIVGEGGLISARPRTATVKASRDCKPFDLEQREFHHLLQSSEDFRRMERLYEERRPRPGTGV